MADNENYGRRKTDRVDAQYSRTYKGKTYNLIDIQNLKDANKEMAEQLRLKQEDFKVQEAFIKKMDERIAKGKQISQLDQNIYNDFKKQQTELNNMASIVGDYIDKNNKKIEELSKNWTRFITNTMQNPTNGQDVIQSIVRQNNANNKPMPKSISELFRQTLTDSHERRKENTVKNIYQNVAENVTNKYKRQGADFTDPSVVAKMNSEIQQETNKKASGALKKFSVGAELINVASNTFSKAVDVWGRLFRAGMDNQSQAYEDTFTNVSVRNGTTRQNYADAKWRMNNYLDEKGLRNNIASSEVYRMWDKMATSGIQIDLSNEESRAEISAKAIDNVLTSKIVPYLDTTTAQWDQLVSAQPELQKNIRGINRLNTEIAGNNYVTKDLLQNILDDLQPISDSALNDMAMSAAGATTFINSMMESGMDEATAKSLWTEYYKEQQYGAQILRSGTTAEKMSMTNAMVNGINLYDSSHTGKALGNIAGTYATTSSWGPGYGDTTSGVVQSSVNMSVGTDPRFAMWYHSQNGTAENTIEEAVANSEKAMKLYSEYGTMAGNEFANDTNQTNKKLQEITVENLMNELSVINDWLGHWSGVLETAIKGIGAILLTKLIGGVIGKGIGLLSGVGGAAAGASSGGLFATLGAAGPIGLGIAAVGAGIAIGNAIAQKISQNQQEDKKEKEQGLTSEYLKSGKASNEASATFQAISDASNESQSYQNEQLETYGIKDSPQWFSGAETDIKYTLEDAQEKHNWEAYNQAKAFKIYGSTSFDKDFQKKALLAFAIALDHDNMLSGTFDKLGIQFNSAEDIKSTIKDLGYTVTDVFAAFNGLMSPDLDGYPADGKGGYTDLHQLRYSINTVKKYFDLTPEEEALYRKIGYHRQGLDNVPVDNYPALLHQGEAVLTAATANELRSLLDEYRDTTQQTVNFDNIIRTQTQDLITKMDEIKQVMINNSSSIGNFVDSMQQTKAKDTLYTSMKMVKSTKSF